MPNITGDLTQTADSTTADFLGDGIITSSGAFEITYKSKIAVDNPSAQLTDGIPNALSFDASRSSPIYGNSTTVMPDSVNLPVAIYLG